MKPRYSIVRVDKDYYLNSCPAGFENINNDFVCMYRKDKVLNRYVHNCKKCRYGDTKEQLIRKVAQKIFEDKNRQLVYTFGQEYLLKKYINMHRKKSLKLAKEIVEFLGVEE